MTQVVTPMKPNPKTTRAETGFYIRYPGLEGAQEGPLTPTNAPSSHPYSRASSHPCRGAWAALPTKKLRRVSNVSSVKSMLTSIVQSTASKK